MGQPARFEMRTTQRPAEPVPARWKEIAGEDDVTQYRALCGRCARGSLGLLKWIRWKRFVLAQIGSLTPELRDLEYGWILIFRDVIKGRYPVLWREDFSEVTRAARFEAQELAAAIAEYAASVELARPHDFSVYQRLLTGMWIMFPEIRGVEAGTPAAHIPRPIYVGFADNGYRISSGGRRSRGGRRVGRRPIGGSLPDAHDFTSQPEKARPVTGQIVIPPCRIWCPRCGALNEAPVPDGFRSTADVADPERTR